MSTAAERMRKFRVRMMDARGLKTVAVIIPAALEPELRIIARRLCNNPNLEFGPLRDSASRKLVSSKE